VPFPKGSEFGKAGITPMNTDDKVAGAFALMDNRNQQAAKVAKEPVANPEPTPML